MDNYEILSKIGDGAFGTVYLCRKQNDASNKCDLVAIKKMKRRYYSWDECLKSREIEVLKKLNHCNIVTLKEVIRENNQLLLVFEHMEDNLHQIVQKRTVPFSEPSVRQIIVQILSGLAYIHEHGFFHRDIKPENLLCKNGIDLIKIADFGLTREIDSQPPFTDYVSTRWYRAPELLLHSRSYNWTVDMWAVGCIAAELYTLSPMFPGRSEIDQIFKICQVLGKPDVAAWPEGEELAKMTQFNFPNIVPLQLTDVLGGCSAIGVKFIESVVRWNPDTRYSAKELLAHPYITDNFAK